MRLCHRVFPCLHPPCNKLCRKIDNLQEYHRCTPSQPCPPTTIDLAGSAPRELLYLPDRPTISPLTIPLVYCHINGFQRASSVEKPWLGGEKRRGGQASHHE